MSAAPDWKADLAAKRRQRERETDVERRWQDVMDKNGEGAPEWLKEAAMKKKAMQKQDDGLVPWMREVKRTNKDLARKIAEVHQAEKEAAEVTAAQQPPITAKETTIQSS
ncbi:hypothetical protein T265_06203 [Opisthorchis viverrini]|uniref:Uncharacterized protein n=1 Tax=Opisthorchis viverrini TaxID=6198 RepID=A0A075AE85_OPIVI|nr:hypothetical protein T265_06203 [Opisthorchis viverrini]KER26559.1 hypothetical protein T265_06203 [Opisthorchis viverrini]